MVEVPLFVGLVVAVTRTRPDVRPPNGRRERQILRWRPRNGGTNSKV